MLEPWSEPLTVSYLKWLATPLKQNLAQAARLWVWLHLLYGEELVRLDLPTTFTYADCRHGLFSASHPTQDAKPPLHDQDCPCAKTAAAWLFSGDLLDTQEKWVEIAASTQVQASIQQFKQMLGQHNELPKQFDKFLNTRLFGVTRRTLASDLEALTERGWLRSVAGGYQRVETLPVMPTESKSTMVDFLVQPDLASMATNLAQRVNGQRRFFVHVDYVVPQNRHDQVEDWQDLLRQLWQQTPTTLVSLRYWSVTLLRLCTLIVYPVCIYYYRRGPYLCGYGQVPGKNDQLVDWRNYRLDRIQSITPISWDEAAIPERLGQQYRAQALPEADEIELRMAEAWGFDYYQPPRMLLLRFDMLWDQRYIQNSLRHHTFQPISFQQAQTLIQSEVQGEKQQYLLQILLTRPSQDAYYRAIYRHNDPNVRQRLRAWRPHVEVILPWDLRQQVATEVRQELEWYR
ncbi:CRISPR-associated protein, TIGR03985 family [Leptolyngbya sp. PCC 7375]|nr:CRISPR-associated protein, TIGR03985 family [Leptolyngbya sp. PCC 7375]